MKLYHLKLSVRDETKWTDHLKLFINDILSEVLNVSDCADEWKSGYDMSNDLCIKSKIKVVNEPHWKWLNVKLCLISLHNDSTIYCG